jgi:hypothetical protein
LTFNIGLNSDLIDNFRKKVNEEPFFREKFRNINGKNYWNILCSSMDWVTVSVDGLNGIKLKSGLFGYNHLNTLNLMQYIICVDTLVESIIQMHRVLYNDKSYPLDESKEIFEQSKLSDDKYFKHIRAVFGTHPVNLNSLDGVKNNDGERFYASWVSQNGIDADYEVFLYSNNPDKDELYQFGIKIEKINEYATSRYNLIELLIERVDTLLKEHIEEYKIRIIPNLANPLEQLWILHDENEKRFGQNLGYAGRISYLKELFSINIEEYEFDDYFTDIFNEYKEFMALGISKISDGLQEMNTDNFRIELMYTGYEFEKIYEYLRDGEHPVGKEYFHGLLEKGKLPLKLSTINDFVLNRLILDAFLFHTTRKLNNRSIALNEIVKMQYPYK